jgi:hypothetical protein
MAAMSSEAGNAMATSSREASDAGVEVRWPGVTLSPLSLSIVTAASQAPAWSAFAVGRGASPTSAGRRKRAAPSRPSTATSWPSGASPGATTTASAAAIEPRA